MTPIMKARPQVGFAPNGVSPKMSMRIPPKMRMAGTVFAMNLKLALRPTFDVCDSVHRLIRLKPDGLRGDFRTSLPWPSPAGPARRLARHPRTDGHAAFTRRFQERSHIIGKTNPATMMTTDSNARLPPRSVAVLNSP